MNVGVGESADFSVVELYREHGREKAVYRAVDKSFLSVAFGYFDEGAHACEFFYLGLRLSYVFGYFSHR